MFLLKWCLLCMLQLKFFCYSKQNGELAVVMTMLHLIKRVICSK